MAASTELDRFTGQAIAELQWSNRLALLEAVAIYYRARSLTASAPAADALYAIATARLFAFLILERLWGWRQWCKEVGAHPDGPEGLTVGLEVIREAEQVAPADAYTAAGALSHYQHHYPGQELQTAGVVVEQLRVAYAAAVERYRGMHP